MKTLVLGLGSSILGDDGVGLRVVREVGKSLKPGLATVVETNAAGLALLDELNGYERAVIVDAIETGDYPPGHIIRLNPDSLNFARHVSSCHDVDFATALDLGRRLGMAVPPYITIFGIEIVDPVTFSEECTPPVEQAIPRCVGMVIDELIGGAVA